MKIKHQLVAGSFLLVAFAAGTGAYVIHVARQTEAVARQSHLALDVIRGVFELNALTQEYVTHQEERPKVQWRLQQDALVDLLASPDFLREPSLSRVGALQAGTRELGYTFEELVRQVEAPDPDHALHEQLNGDLLVKARTVTRRADDLALAAFRARASLRAAANRTMIALLAFLTFFMTLTLSYLYRRIAGSIDRLQKGTRLVGAGDLDHRVGNSDDDEIGDLSRAFDAMTAKLKAAYDTLEAKVKERTTELHAVSARNELLLDSIGDAVVAIDRLWNVTLWNPAAARMTGWSEAEAVGKPFRQLVRFVREHDRKENIAFVEEAMLYGETKQMSNSTLLLTRDGREIPVGDSAAPIFGKDGEVAGVIVVFRDATAEKEATLLRTDFAYASHQMRTPVNKALWSVEMAIDEAKGGKLEEPLRTAQRAMKDVEKMAERLLAVSEIDQGLVVAKFAEFELKPFLKGLLDKVQPYAEARGVKLSWPKTKNGETLDADRKLLEGLINELTLNAIMYSLPGGTVEFELQVSPLEIVMRIRDAGIGISDEQKPLIFTKFFRGQNVPSDAAGTGLGLFIARAYAKLMGGKIWFESELGKGTTFNVSLPRLRGMRR